MASAMHVVSIAFECGAFDPNLMRSGTSSLVWNSARAMAAAGHRVSVVTPAHGREAYLRRVHGARWTDYRDSHRVPLALDPAVWKEVPAQVRVDTRSLLLRRDGVDLHFLSNEFLDAYPELFYPDAADEGGRLAFLKPEVFQMDAVRFVRGRFGTEALLVQAYEPVHHYLVPPALRSDPGMTVVSTVATNNPVNQQVYRPQLLAMLEALDAGTDLDGYRDPPARTGALADAMAWYLPQTRLDPGSGHDPDRVGLYSLIVEHADGVDFLGEGQRAFYTTFAGTPFEERFRQLAVSRFVERNAHKYFVGGCAISDSWLARDPSAVDRGAVLGGLGLDPALPTFYHAARYSVHHKGQLELIRAVGRVLDSGRRANFLIRCAVGTGISAPAGTVDPYFQRIANRHPDLVRLDWRMVGEDTLFQQAASADFCVFPSKYEQDTFLIAQGEAMACGAVPIATAQEATRHFGHAFAPEQPGATGFAVPRSFREDDELLTTALAACLERAADLLRDDPAEYARLSARARATARGLTWERSARQRADAFGALLERRRPAAPIRPHRPWQPGGSGRARHSDGVWTVEYRCAEADRVEAFLPSSPAADDRYMVLELHREGDVFRGRAVAGRSDQREVALLVTLPRGRSGWATVPTR